MCCGLRECAEWLSDWGPCSGLRQCARWFEDGSSEEVDWTEADADHYKKRAEDSQVTVELARAILNQGAAFKEATAAVKEATKNLEALQKIEHKRPSKRTPEDLALIYRFSRSRQPNDPIRVPLRGDTHSSTSPIHLPESVSTETLSAEQLQPIVQNCREALKKARSVTGSNWGVVDMNWQTNPDHRKNIVQNLYQGLLNQGLTPTQIREVFKAFPQDELKTQVLSALAAIERDAISHHKRA